MNCVSINFFNIFHSLVNFNNSKLWPTVTAVCKLSHFLWFRNSALKVLPHFCLLMMLVLCGFGCCCIFCTHHIYDVVHIQLPNIYPSSLNHLLTIPTWAPYYRQTLVEVYLLSSSLDVSASKPCRILLPFHLNFCSPHPATSPDPPKVYKFWSGAPTLGPHPSAYGFQGIVLKLAVYLSIPLLAYVLWG